MPNVISKPYRPTKKEREEMDFVYEEVDEMIKARDLTYRQFNDRTLISFLDDSEKRIQGYVPSREAQGKEDWQSNVFNQASRNKLKALVAAVASTPPQLRYRAVSLEDGGMDLRRAEVMENLVKQSRDNANQEASIFWEAWTCATQGTVVKYDGYLKTKYKRKFIKSYDLATGEMDFEEKEVEVEDECVDVLVPLAELFIKDFHIHDLQAQSAIAWIRYLDKAAVKKEFGQYKNFEYVEGKSSGKQYQNETRTFFNTSWKSRVEGEDEYEVIKYYNRFLDKYCVVVNGVLLLAAPMLWGRKQKLYPFSKTIFEPFSGRDFFYGNSLPNANMDVQDVINTLYNMSLDKTYRSLNPPLLAGIKNKDLLEMENENIGMENTIYVEDINQIQYQRIPGINDSEMAMVKWVSQGLDLGTMDMTQQGVAGRGVTAREIVIANENAKKLKGLFFMFLTDLWIQKTKLRILNILMNYTSPKVKEIVGEKGNKIYQESFRTILVEGSKFPDGSTGTLAIQFVKDRDSLPTSDQLGIEEEKMRLQGERFEKIALVHSYLDEFEYDVQVVSESLYQKDSAEAQAIVQEKIQTMAAYFPQIFLANQDVIFEDFAEAYGEDSEKYSLSPQQPQSPIPGTPEQGGAPSSGSGGSPSALPALSANQRSTQ
jgi:hypothetical protein